MGVIWMAGLVALAMAAAAAEPAQQPGAIFYVAANGSDGWSGRLAAPNRKRNDGPFATLGQARDAVRALKKAGPLPRGGVAVRVRAGTYYLPETLRLGPEDSGTPQCPIVYEAYPGERPVLSGGRPITGWQKEPDGRYTAKLPQKGWHFRQLFVDGRRKVRARYPNFDPAHPTTGGWLFVEDSVYVANQAGPLGLMIANIGTPGDWIDYRVSVPAAGEYTLWLRYSAFMKPWDNVGDMSGHTAISVDGGPKLPLVDVADTGSWDTRFRWGRCATLSLTAGEHTLRWSNEKGGGINLDVWALSDDPAWKPTGMEPEGVAPGRHALLFQAEKYAGQGTKAMRVQGGGKGRPDRFIARPGDIRPGWAEAPDAEVHIFAAWGWFNEICRIQGVDPETRVVSLTGAEAKYDIRPGNRYFVENVRSELDAPGEWFLDREAGVLHTIPDGPTPDRVRVVAPVLDRLVEIVGTPTTRACHITLRGFTLQETDYTPDHPDVYTPSDAAVLLQDACFCKVESNLIRNVGGYGIRLHLDSCDNTIRGNEVAAAGAGGVLLTSNVTGGGTALAGDRAPCAPIRNFISDNHLHHLGLIHKHVGGVFLDRRPPEMATAQGNIVSHNLIHDSARYGTNVLMNWGNNVIEYNDVINVCLETNDTSGINFCTRNRQSTGNVVRGNRVRDCIGFGTTANGEILTPYYTWGIYLDDHTSGTRVEGNITARNVRGGFYIHGGQDNVAQNNIFVEGRDTQVYFSRIPQGPMEGNRLERNVVVYSRPEAVVYAASGWSERTAVVDRNLYWCTGGPVAIGLAPSWEEWVKRGLDAHSVVADPLFRDPGKDDYTMRPESPALDLGFQPIDTARIGLIGRKSGPAGWSAR